MDHLGYCSIIAYSTKYKKGDSIDPSCSIEKVFCKSIYNQIINYISERNQTDK